MPEPQKYHIKLTDGKVRRGHVVTTFSYEGAKAKAEQRAKAFGRGWKVVAIEQVDDGVEEAA
jgi:hypothetical protein